MSLTNNMRQLKYNRVSSKLTSITKNETIRIKTNKSTYLMIKERQNIQDSISLLILTTNI